MTFKLIRTDQDSSSTTLLPGSHEFGRGVFLDCKDRRVARQHAQLTISEDNIILTALHKNPCFVIVKGSPGLVVMAKGMTKELKEGDEFGLLPDQYWYRLTKNEDNVECQNEPLQQSSTTCEERSGAVVKSLDSSSLLGDVGKEQPSTSDTPAETTDKNSPALDTIMPSTPDVKCKHSSPSAKQTTLSTEALHYDGEPQLKKMKRNLMPLFSSAPKRGDKDADSVKLHRAMSPDFSQDEGLVDADAVVGAADETRAAKRMRGRRGTVRGASSCDAGSRGAKTRGAEVRGAGPRGAKAGGAGARGAGARHAGPRGAKERGAGARAAGACGAKTRGGGACGAKTRGGGACGAKTRGGGACGAKTRGGGACGAKTRGGGACGAKTRGGGARSGSQARPGSRGDSHPNCLVLPHALGLRKIGARQDDVPCRKLRSRAPPAPCKLFAPASLQRTADIKEKLPTKTLKSSRRPKPRQVALTSSPAKIQVCATLPPLDQTKEFQKPSGLLQSNKPFSTISTMSCLESGSEIWPILLCKSKKVRSLDRAPTTPATSASVFSPFTDDFGEAVPIVSSSDPVTLQPIPSTSSGVSVGQSKPSRQAITTDQNDDGIIIEFIDETDCSDLSATAKHAEYGSDNESDNDWDDVFHPIADDRFHRMAEAVDKENEFLATNEPELIALVDRVTEFEDDAVEAVDPAALGLFAWSNDFTTFKGEREEFRGVAGPTTLCTDPLTCFLKFWDESIMSVIVLETNRYADQCLATELTKGSRLHRWKPTTLEEMYVLFSIFILQSVFPLTMEQEYWRPKSPYTQVQFSKVMTYDRFILLKSLLHFSNNEEIACNNHEDAKLAKLQPLIDHLSEKFSSSYTPNQNIAIDESLTLWKGKLSFKQYIKTKASKYGVKSHELCESRTGYLWKFYLYTGKSAVPPTSEERAVLGTSETAGATTLMVIKLMHGILDKGYTLFMDNFYNCPSLARYLKSNGTDCVGTLRPNRKHVPRAITHISKQSLSKGEMLSLHSGDVTVFSWRDENMVSMISTYHKNTFLQDTKAGSIKKKPSAVMDYNASMGGVDMKDQRLSCFKMERIRNEKWYKKIFKRLLNVSILNAYVIYSESYKTVHAGSKCLPHRDFRYEIANSLIDQYNDGAQPTVVCHVRLNPKINRPMVKNNHFPFQYESVDGKERPRKRCVVCRSRTAYYCNVCTHALCVPHCHYSFHTTRGPIT